MEPCINKVIWGVVPNGESAIPACASHTGNVMENVFLRRGAEYGFAYVAKHDLKGVSCHGADGGKEPLKVPPTEKQIHLKVKHEVLTTEPPEGGTPSVGIRASTRVVGPSDGMM